MVSWNPYNLNRWNTQVSPLRCRLSYFIPHPDPLVLRSPHFSIYITSFLSCSLVNYPIKLRRSLLEKPADYPYNMAWMSDIFSGLSTNWKVLLIAALLVAVLAVFVQSFRSWYRLRSFKGPFLATFSDLCRYLSSYISSLAPSRSRPAPGTIVIEQLLSPPLSRVDPPCDRR
jgi:hypothetical protein